MIHKFTLHKCLEVVSNIHASSRGSSITILVNIFMRSRIYKHLYIFDERLSQVTLKIPETVLI